MQHSPEPIIDPYLVAYLAGGPSRAIETAVVALLQHGLVSLRFDGRRDVLVSQSAQRAPLRFGYVESTIRERIQRAGAGVIPALLLREADLARGVAGELRRRGLIAPPDAPGKPWKFLLLCAVMLIIPAIAFVPGLLVPLGGAAFMVWISLPGSPSQDRILPAAHELVARARGATRGPLADAPAEIVVLAVACHGTSVLAGGPHAALHQALVDPPPEARPVGDV